MPRPKAKRTFENLRFAIEIEVEFPSKKDSQKLISKHRIIRGWALDYDGCFDSKTLILTNRGWIYFKDLKLNDKVLSMNPLNSNAEYCKINKIIDKQWDKAIYYIENNRLSMGITPNHYLYGRTDKNSDYKFLKADDIYINDYFPNAELRIPRTFNWKGTWKTYKNISIGNKIIPIKTWVKFLGLYLSEGYVKPNVGITITQAVGSKYNNQIRQVLKAMPFKTIRYTKHSKRINEQDCFQYVINNKEFANYLLEFGDHCYNKRIPQNIKELTPTYLNMFLQYYGFGDGFLKPSNNWNYTTTSYQLALDTQELILKTGRYASICKQLSKKETERDKYIINVYDHVNKEHVALIGQDMKTENYNDRVYCVETEPYNLVYVMRDGTSYWSRNSLDNGAEYRPKDRNKLYWNEDSIDQIKEIVGLIKAHKGHIKGSTCGFHVHVDMTKFSNKEICNIIKAYIKQQTKIYKQFNVLKCRLDYAQKIPTTVLKHLTEANIKKVRENDTCYGEGNDYFNERHYGCNVLALQKHGTLEFRMINGTIQISRIKAYIKWCLEFCLKYAKGGK